MERIWVYLLPGRACAGWMRNDDDRTEHGDSAAIGECGGVGRPDRGGGSFCRVVSVGQVGGGVSGSDEEQ